MKRQSKMLWNQKAKARFSREKERTKDQEQQETRGFNEKRSNQGNP